MGISDLPTEGFRQRRTSPSLIADVLRDAILRGGLSGGQQLTQDELAAQFGISRIPVREALWQLQGEGLVRLHPHRGAVVSQLSGEELRELMEIRIALDTLAIRLAMPHMTDEVLERAAEIIEDTRNDAEAAAHWGQYNWEFHSTLYAPAKRPHLLAMIELVHNNVARYLHVQVSAMDYKEKGLREHHEFLDACKRRDTEEAVALLRQHLEGVTDLLSPYFEQNADQRTSSVSSTGGD